MLSNMYEGMVVEVDIGPVTHPGVVVRNGLGWGIIHNALFKEVTLSSVDEFSSGRTIRPSNRYQSQKPAWQVVQDAYAKIGTPWSLGYNCQHFVSDVLGLARRSHDMEAITLITSLIVLGIIFRQRPI